MATAEIHTVLSVALSVSPQQNQERETRYPKSLVGLTRMSVRSSRMARPFYGRLGLE
jgi:hypothetical protein